MKKGYKMLLLFSSIIFSILFFNSFIINFLSSYMRILFLIILLVIFYYAFVMEKDKHRYLSDIFFETFIFVVSFFILYYILGFVVGLAKTPNYLNIKGLFDFIIPITLYCILREIFRYNMLCKADENIICTIVVVILFIFFDITNDIYYLKIDSKYAILRFIALSLLPAISRSISYSYITKKIGYKVVIVFDLVFSLYLYIIPILPNPNEYISSIIKLLIPIVFAYRILKFFDAKKDNLLPSNYHKIRFKNTMIPVIPMLIMVYLYSGYFRFFAVAIASGSMSPKIDKGDVVIIDKKVSTDKIDIGQVLAYKKEDIIVVHRVVKKTKVDGKYLFYTKGDANNNIDDLVITEDMIIGKVKHKIKYIGYPTVWFNEI